jgi:hypothetical protein
VRAGRSAVLAALLSAAPAMAQDRPRFTVTEVRYDVLADAVVGARRSGLLCTPAGKLRWTAVAPDRRRLTDRLSAALHDAGLDVRISSDDDFDREVRTPLRITVTLERARVSACVPWMGLRVGKAAKQRASGEIETVWRVFDQKRRILVFKAAFCTAFKTESDTGDAVGSAFLKLAPTVSRRVAAAEPLDAKPELTAADSTCEAGAV